MCIKVLYICIDKFWYKKRFFSCFNNVMHAPYSSSSFFSLLIDEDYIVLVIIHHDYKLLYRTTDHHLMRHMPLLIHHFSKDKKFFLGWVFWRLHLLFKKNDVLDYFLRRRLFVCFFRKMKKAKYSFPHMTTWR